jgi:hypothetical protein
MVSERIDETRALFNPATRNEVRQRMRRRLQEEPGLLAPPLPSAPAPGTTKTRGGTPSPMPSDPLTAHVPVVREAAAARVEIRRLLDALPKNDRAMLPDVNASADALVTRIEQLAAAQDELERADVPEMSDAIEHEITALEAEANPLDEEGSERRIRRLAQLRRQRISLRDVRVRRQHTTQQLARCVSAIHTMRMDLARLAAGTGDRSYASVTQIAEQAMQLGGEVDAVLYAHDELTRLFTPQSGRT